MVVGHHQCRNCSRPWTHRTGGFSEFLQG